MPRSTDRATKWTRILLGGGGLILCPFNLWLLLLSCLSLLRLLVLLLRQLLLQLLLLLLLLQLQPQLLLLRELL